MNSEVSFSSQKTPPIPSPPVVKCRKGRGGSRCLIINRHQFNNVEITHIISLNSAEAPSYLAEFYIKTINVLSNEVERISASAQRNYIIQMKIVSKQGCYHNDFALREMLSAIETKRFCGWSCPVKSRNSGGRFLQFCFTTSQRPAGRWEEKKIKTFQIVKLLIQVQVSF